jgi:hypothetical protein
MAVTGHEFTIDHIDPEARGGSDDVDNLCSCCSECNTYKQARTEAPDPRTGRIVPLFNPRVDDWNTHFRWSATATRLLGRTASGRATVLALRLNRPRLVQSRRLWVQYDLHPPEIRHTPAGEAQD